MRMEKLSVEVTRSARFDKRMTWYELKRASPRVFHVVAEQEVDEPHVRH